jgi:hypothetical protein
MSPLLNATPFQALDVPMQDAQGREVVAVIVKATFERARDGRLVRASKPSPIRVGDVLRDPEAPESSALYPSDVCLEKRGTCVVVVGEAISRAPVTSMDIAVRVRQRTVPLRVHGERLFYRGATDVLIGPAAPFERMSVIYERAYGGASEDRSVYEARNPAGVGVAKNKVDLVDTRAPQIEHPARPHKTAGDRHPPVGFGAILPHWSPRRDHTGTRDAVWERTRMPLPPPDFDVRYANVAHPSLIFDEPVVANDTVAVLGMSADGLFSCEIPRWPVVLRARADKSGLTSRRPAIDTVILEPARGRLELVVRSAFSVGRGTDVLRELRVDEDDE